MTKTLDFNSVQRPTLELTMKDDARTKIYVSTPTEALVEELQTVVSELEDVLQHGEASGIQAVFDLAARLISCNRAGLQVIASDLRGKYGLDLEDIVIFFGAYVEFITEITSAKN